MREARLRSLARAGVGHILGLPATQLMESRLLGGKAVALRAHLAHRAYMALFFHSIKLASEGAGRRSRHGARRALT